MPCATSKYANGAEMPLPCGYTLLFAPFEPGEIFETILPASTTFALQMMNRAEPLAVSVCPLSAMSIVPPLLLRLKASSLSILIDASPERASRPI